MSSLIVIVQGTQVTLNKFTANEKVRDFATVEEARTFAHACAKKTSDKFQNVYVNVEDYTESAPAISTYLAGRKGQAWASRIDEDGVGSGWNWKESR